jgi:branched-chain amino acid transport system permease protein
VVENIGPNIMGLITAPFPDSWLKAHLLGSAEHMRLLTMGVILLLVMRFSPRGLIPEK